MKNQSYTAEEPEKRGRRLLAAELSKQGRRQRMGTLGVSIQTVATTLEDWCRGCGKDTTVARVHVALCDDGKPFGPLCPVCTALGAGGLSEFTWEKAEEMRLKAEGCPDAEEAEELRQRSGCSFRIAEALGELTSWPSADELSRAVAAAEGEATNGSAN